MAGKCEGIQQECKTHKTPRECIAADGEGCVGEVIECDKGAVKDLMTYVGPHETWFGFCVECAVKALETGLFEDVGPRPLEEEGEEPVAFNGEPMPLMRSVEN